uniref:Ras family protein n=1 Tax=Arcella intermedia TaxID=1963864 RepID=A0A6B2LQ08_9EUKA
MIVRILDTAGQIEFSSMKDLWIRTGEYFIFLFSLTDKKSFEELDAVVEHIRRVKDIDHCPMIMVGCKADLETERQVTPEMIQKKRKGVQLYIY